MCQRLKAGCSFCHASPPLFQPKMLPNFFNKTSNYFFLSFCHTLEIDHGIWILSPKSEFKLKKHFFWFKRVLYQGPEQRESKWTVLCLLIIIILISYIIIYYIIIKLLIVENHPSQNWKWNSKTLCFVEISMPYLNKWYFMAANKYLSWFHSKFKIDIENVLSIWNSLIF